MKKISVCLVAAVLVALLVLPTALAESIDVTGFWYSEEDGEGIELRDGVAVMSDEDGETIAEGNYSLSGTNVDITTGHSKLEATVDGNTLTLEDGRLFVRDGIEVGYWLSVQDDSALELYEGQVWRYNEEGDVLSEGTYTLDGNQVTIVLDGKTMTGIIDDGEMIIDGELFVLL